MRKAVNILEYVQLRIAAIFFVIFIVSVALQVASRYIPGIHVVWSNQVATYSFIWMVFMGAAVMVRYREHFRLGILIENTKGIRLVIIQSLIHFIIIGFGAVMIIDGLTLTEQFWGWTITNLPQLQQGYVWVAIPVSGFTMIVYSLGNFLDDIKDYSNKGREWGK
ncbi:TRAP transporter small permease [Salicibibacter halophilus]|uniref:TRAP transporter small permease n=1 Tax=Salicibibacter halophilus TaxID=2502791 RepID=A0A514LL12_9BACI|nr:TRAP transporter small permease [Salicibibacter halophilus]QDI92564.1 TRAP transporter small permease [Salicibibacter halophilus]